jgi:hypothetical protein
MYKVLYLHIHTHIGTYMTSLINGDLVARASHIHIYEILTTTGDLVGVLSTKNWIKSFPNFKDIVSVNDSNYTQAWLSAEDTDKFLAAHDAFNA